jgi:hypothetical protein
MIQGFKVSFHFQRHEVEAMDTERFDQVFPPGGMPAQMLRHYAGVVQFGLAGFKGENREAFVIPSVRRYLAALDLKTDGAFAFLSELETPFMLVVAACRLQHLTILQADHWNRTGVHFDNEELHKYLATGSCAIRRLGERGELSRTAIGRRENQFLRYFEKNLH